MAAVQVHTSDDSDARMSVAERRARRPNRQLPLRYRDIVPETLPPFPPLPVPGYTLLVL